MSSHSTMDCHQPAARKQRFLIKSGQVDVDLGLYAAAILHPSLGCPLIVEDSQKVSLFLVAGPAFKDAFLSGNSANCDFGARGGNNIRLIVNQHLKIQLWEKSANTQKNLARADETLYAYGCEEKIHCSYLGTLGTELRDKDRRHFANLRPATCRQFNHMGLSEVFQVDLLQFPFAPQTLYDAFWALDNSGAQLIDLLWDFVDLRDRMLRSHVHLTWPQGPNPPQDVARPAFSELCAFRVDDREGLHFESDPDHPLQSRHPIFVPAAGKDSLNLGHLSDVHVSSRQHAYKGKRAQVIPGVDESASPPIGAMANNNADNFFDLLVQLGGDPDVDLLIITGDLYDHLHNFDPRSRDTATMGKLWEALYVDSVTTIEARSAEYPYGIDGVAVYSLLVYFYSRYQKPVLVVSGNHEAYAYPYGISPRVTGVGRVNEGIPLDHNLTFYEAILLYGPGYDKVLKNFNFGEEHFDWFSSAFAPLADFALTYKNQCLIGMEWGQSESFMRTTARRGGTLPRADKTLTPAQRSLVQTALAQGKTSVLCTHFTLINYCTSKPLNERGEFAIEGMMQSAYDQGSSQRERTSLYEQFLRHPALRLTLSGHAHRVGLYGWQHQESITFVNKLPAKIKCRGYHPESDAAQLSRLNPGAQVFVTASAGPIAKQNLRGEMSGQGMELPSAGKIVFNGDTPRISLVKSRCRAAKPRFAVACDYIDVMQGGFWEYFKALDGNGTFEMKVCWEKIHPEFPREKRADFIESVTFWLVGDGDARKYESQISLSSQREIINVNFGRRLMLRLEEGYSNPAFFLSLKFKNMVFKDISGFQNYDYESPWIIQIGIYDHRGRDIANPIGHWLYGKPSTDPSTWQIMRHKDYGETPSFRWRKENWESEFDYKV